MTYVVMGSDLHTGCMREKARFDTWLEAYAYKRICQRWCATVEIEEQAACKQ